MKRIAAFLKATTLGGLFVLLPVVVLFVLATEITLSLRSWAQVLMETFAGHDSVVTEFPMIYAVLIVVGLSFAIGLAMISRRGRSVGSWIERTMLFRVPGYSALRAVIGGMTNVESEGVVKPGLLRTRDGVESFVFITEDHGNGKLTIFMPGTPNPGSGSVKIVPKELVNPLHVRISTVANALQQWGVGSARLLARHERYWDGREETGETQPMLSEG
ncbi:MAG: DUF502 domain-containing protein [Verrucomicrobiaceae bacterium]|nr:DUF502 domain-containing protein [Verrucomicrobiaceae bacterium]